MATKYNIAVDLSANPTALISGFAAAEAAMDKFNRNVTNSVTGITNAFGKINGAADRMKMSLGNMNTNLRYVNSNLSTLNARAKANTTTLNNTNTALKGLGGSYMSEFSKANAALTSHTKKLNNATEFTRQSVGKMNATVASTATNLNKLSGSLQTTAVGMKDVGNSFKGVDSSLKGSSSSTSKAATGLTNTGKAASLAARDLDRFNRMGRGVSMTAMGIGAAVVGGIGASLYVFTQYESALAGVAKTTDASAKQLRQFDLAFREMSRAMPAGYEEIANVAEAAAQLGVKNKDITKFTDTMIRMGTSTNLASEDAANALARMMNIMGTAGSDVDRFGSTIVKMGNVSAATEQDIVNMGMRIAGMGKSLDMSEADVVALATSLSDLGVRAEMGGSAISTIMSKTASAIEQGTETGQKWAKTMGMSIGEVKKLFKEDAYGALIKMVEGLEKVKESGGNVDKTLRDLGINEMRQLDVMKRLIGSSNDLSSAQRTANEEWKTNTALINESTKRYETFGSQVKMIWNGIKNIAANIGGAFAKADGGSLAWIKNIIDGLEDMTNKFFDAEGGISRLGQAFVDQATLIGGIAAVVATAGAAFMMFGTGGAVVVGVAAGLGVIALAFKELVDTLNGKTGMETAFDALSIGVSEATDKSAREFLRLKDSVRNTMIDIQTSTSGMTAELRDKMVSEVAALTDAIINEINKKESKILDINKRLLKSATGQEKAMLEQTHKDIKAHFDRQRTMVQDAQGNITKIMNNAYKDRRVLNDQEYSDLTTLFGKLDKTYSMHVSKNVGELQKLTKVFSTFDKDTKFENIQKNVTAFAEQTVEALGQLEKGFEKQKGIIEASGLPIKVQAGLMSSLTREYDENRNMLIGNLHMHEEAAKKLNKNVDATRNLSDEQKLMLGTLDRAKHKYADYGTAVDTTALAENARTTEIKSLNQALKESEQSMSNSKKMVEGVATAYLGAGKNIGTLKEAFNTIKTEAPAAAKAAGTGFISEFKNGVGIVDLGTAGKMKVDEFVQGIKSGAISVNQAMVAQINGMRNQIGLHSLTPEGEKAILQFSNGLKSANLAEIAKGLGLSLKSGMKIDLGAEGKMSVEQFVAGLKSGQYSMVEVMTMFQNTLKTASKTDLTTAGSETTKTLVTGMNMGLISADQMVQAFKGKLKEGVKADLTGEGQITMQSLVKGYESGKYSAETFLLGFKELLKASAKADLTLEGQQAMTTFGTGLNIGKADPVAKAQQSRTEIEQLLFGTSGLTGGQNAMTTFGSGITAFEGVPAGAATRAKSAVEQALGLTTDAGGGANAMTLFNAGIATLSANPIIAAGLVSTNVETELGNTTDGGGGAKAGNSFLTGFIPFIGSSTAQASEMKAGVENRLGSTHDGGGGAKAGAKMAADLSAKTGATNTAANSHKQTAEKTMGSTTDGGGGSKAGTKFSSDLQNKTGASRNAASSNKNAVEGVLRTANDGGGGRKAGTEFVQGVQNQSGNARNAGSNVANSGRSGLGSAGSAEGLGRDLAWGFIRGIGSLVNEAARVAGNLASAAMSAIKRMQRSNSPSKETMKLGGDFGDGYVIGVVDKAKAAAKSAKTVVGAALDAANKANVGFDMNDVISPINSGTINKRLSAETSQFASVELSGKQPAHINVNVGGQDFYAFSDNIYSASRKKLNFKDRYDV